MRYDRFEREIRYNKKERAFNAFFLSFFTLFFGLCVWATFRNIRMIFADLVVLVLIFFYLCPLIGNIRLLKQLDLLVKNDEGKGIYEVPLYRPKISLLIHTEFFGRRIQMRRYYGVKITDDKKNVYYYFTGELRNLDKAETDKIQDKFYRDINIQCYQNTTIVRTVENDPYFLRF